MASTVSSASLGDAGAGLPSSDTLRTESPPRSRRLDIEPDQHLLGIRQIANDALERLGQMSDQSRNGDDLIALRQRGFFHQVNDLDRVAARQMLLAELLQVGDRGHRLGGLAR